MDELDFLIFYARDRSCSLDIASSSLPPPMRTKLPTHSIIAGSNFQQQKMHTYLIECILEVTVAAMNIKPMVLFNAFGGCHHF